MNKTVKAVCRVMLTASALSLLASLVYYISRWNVLPENPGIHFALDGEYHFDVYAEKYYGFYPHLIGGIAVGLLSLAVHFADKINVGVKVTERGRELFISELCLTLSAEAVLWSGFFTHWSLCVSRQTGLNPFIANHAFEFMMIAALIGIVSQIITCRMNRQKETEQDTSERKVQKIAASRRMSSIVGWLLAVGTVCLLLVIWNRFPHESDEQYYYEHFGYAHFRQFDILVPREFLLIPHALMFALLALFEVLTVRAEKRGNNVLVSLLSDLKMLTSEMFFIAILLLDSEIIPGIGFFIFFAVLYIIALIKYFGQKNKQK